MKTGVLINDFKDININEVKYFFNRDKTKTFLHPESTPVLWFYDEKEIESGIYDFEIEGFVFQRCYIEPFDKEENGLIRYRCGSYYVYKID